MPEIPLKKIPKEEPNPEDRDDRFPPLFNRLNRYRDYNRRMERINQRDEEVEEEAEVMVEEAEVIFEDTETFV